MLSSATHLKALEGVLAHRQAVVDGLFERPKFDSLHKTLVNLCEVEERRQRSGQRGTRKVGPRGDCGREEQHCLVAHGVVLVAQCGKEGRKVPAPVTFDVRHT
jgi:hypothetical protein